MCSACTSSSPSAVNSAAEQSARSLMFGLKAARRRTRAHLVGDALEARDQHLQRRGIEARTRHAALRRRTSAPGLTRLGPPAEGDPDRAVGLGDDHGADPARTDHDRQRQEIERRRPAGGRSQRRHLDRGVRSVVAIAATVLGRERGHGRHAQLM